jgi:hypothetical protein
LDSLLLELLSVFASQTIPDVYWTAVIALAAAFAPVFTTYRLLRRRDALENVLLLTAPFALMGAAGIVLPLLMSSFLNDTRVLEKSAIILERIGAVGYLTDNRLYLEALIPVDVFIVIMPLYSRMLIRRLERKRRLWSVALDCGQEFVFAAGVGFICVKALLSGEYRLAGLSDFEVRLFFYCVVAVAYKAAVCLFVFVYVSALGAKGRKMRKADALPDSGDTTLIALAEQPITAAENASQAIFSMVRRKSLFHFAFCMFPVLVSGFAVFITLPEHSQESSFILIAFGAMFVYMLCRAAGFIARVLVPRLHPLPRHLITLSGGGDFEYAARRFLREYKTPLYKWSGGFKSVTNRRFVLTENFLVDESRLVMRIYNLKDITEIDAGRRVHFRNGKRCNIAGAPDGLIDRLSRYAK